MQYHSNSPLFPIFLSSQLPIFPLYSLVAEGKNNYKRFKTGGLGYEVELSGFYGVIDYGGVFSYLYPLLRAGELVHIGARMSYGLGKNEVVDL